MDALGPELLSTLIDRHAATLELFALQWTESATDVVQTAFLRLSQQSIAPSEAIKWLYRVVRNEAVSTARSEARRRHHESNAARIKENWFLTSPEIRLDAGEASRALAEIPLPQREVIIARLWGQLTFDEIADVLEISSSTAHRNYEAGLIALRKKLGITWLKNQD